MFLPATGKAGNLHKISGKLLFFYWIYIGTFSFGGGTVVQFMIQNTFIYKLKLLTETDYSEIIGIGQITPGINILAYTILIGYRLAGWKGSLLSVLGLILPSALITILLSSIYLLFYDFPIVQHGIRTAFASIFGISCITNYRNVKPILEKGRQAGTFPFFLLLSILALTFFFYQIFQIGIIWLYGLGALIGGFAYILIEKSRRRFL